MATSYPTGLDTYSDVVTGGTILAATTNNVQDSIEALEIKLGIDSSAVTASLDYLVKNSSSTDPGHLHTTSGISGQIAVAQGGTGSSTASAARTALGVAIGSDVQAYDADLTELAGLSDSDGNFIVGSASGWVAESGATARTSIGLGSVENTALSTWAGTTNITTLGTIGTGVWSGTAVADTYVANDLTIAGGTVNSSVIGGSTAAAGTFTQLDIEATGDLRLQDTTGGEYVGWDAPGTVSSSYMMTLPAAIGAVGEVLKINNTDGTLEWGAAGGSSAFTEAVTIDLSSGVGLTISQTGTGNVLDLVSVDSTNVTKTPYVKIDRNAFFKLQFWHGDAAGTGKVFEIVKEGGLTPFLVKNDGDVGIYHRISSVNADEMRILNNSFGSVGNISLSGISLGNTWPGAFPVAGGITGPANHDMFIYPHGTGTLTLGGSTTSESTNIIDAQIPMQIAVNEAVAALSVRQDGAGKTFDFRMAAAGAYSELSYFSSESPKAGTAATTTHFDSGPSNYPNEFKIYPSYMAGGGTAFEVLAKSSNSLFQVGTTNTVGTIGFGANATVTSSVPADKWRWSYGFTLSDISGAGVTFINQTYDSVARSTAIHLDSRGASEGDLVVLDASDNEMTRWNFAGGIDVKQPLTMTVNDANPALTINQSGAGNIFTLQDGGSTKWAMEDTGVLTSTLLGIDSEQTALILKGSSPGHYAREILALDTTGTEGVGIAFRQSGTTKSRIFSGAPSDPWMTLDLADANSAQDGETGFRIEQKCNKATSGDYSALVIDVTDTASPAGLYLTDLRVGGTAKFRVDETGTPIVPLQTPSSASDTGTVGMIKWDAGYIYVCTATDTWERVAVATW